MLDKKGYLIDPEHTGEPVMPVAQGKYMERDDGIPDLCFVPLTMRDRDAVQARNKAFYSIDRRVLFPDSTKYGFDGFWIVAGAPSALIKNYPDKRTGLGFLMYSTSVREERLDVCGWDLVLVDLNIGSSNPSIPTDLGGLSGGGLWRARVYVRDSDRAVFLDEDLSRGVLLSGVVVAQTELVDRRLLAHGPKSIYDRLHGSAAN